MRASLQALATELKRLKASGVKSVVVSEDALQRLRAAVASQPAGVPVARPPAAPKPPESKPSETSAAPKPAPVAEAATGPEEPSIPYVRAERPFAIKTVAAPGAPLPPSPAFQLPAGEKPARWAALRERVLQDPVCRERVRPGKQVVFGVGHLDAKIMFVGEAPGAEEEVQGEPFVGPAGQLLTKMITGMGLKRSDVYIGNIMNWRPDLPLDAGGVQFGNRPPTPEEMAYCLPYLKAQIEVVNPDVLVALGSTAAQALLGPGSFKALGDVRGRWHTFAGKPLMVTYHPSYILRNQSNRSKRMIWEDLLKVMEKVSLPISDKQRSFFLDRA